MITVERSDDAEPQGFDVTISDAQGESRHHVTVARADRDRMAPGAAPEALVEAAFRFLLDREPRDAILPRFELSLISRYFPEFESKIAAYLTARRADRA